MARVRCSSARRVAIVEDAYYVSPNGSDANEGTFASPFATIKKAYDLAAVDGKRVYVRGGVYADEGLKLSKWGTPNEPVAFYTYNGEDVQIGKVIFNGDNARDMKDAANVLDYGMSEDGTSTNNATALRAAIATGKTVWLPKTAKGKCYNLFVAGLEDGGALGLQYPGIFELDGSIVFDDGALIKVDIDTSNAFPVYWFSDVFAVWNRNREDLLYINNPQLDGNYSSSGLTDNWGDVDGEGKSTFYTGDHGHLISIKSSINVSVNGGKLINSSGDGISIGSLTTVSVSANNFISKNIHVEGTIIDKPVRQTLFFGGCKDSVFRNIVGIKYNNWVCAIDLEPGNDYVSVIDNLLFDNCYTESRGSGGEDMITVGTTSFSPKAEPLSVASVSSLAHTWGKIAFVRCTFKGVNCYPVMFTGSGTENAKLCETTTFEKCKFISDYAPFQISGREKILIKDCEVYLTNAAYKEGLIYSRVDPLGAYICDVEIDNLQFHCFGDSQLRISKMKSALVKSSDISIDESDTTQTAERYGALLFSSCIDSVVDGCNLKSQRDAVIFYGSEARTARVANSVLTPGSATAGFNYCVHKGSSATLLVVTLDDSTNVYNYTSPATEKKSWS